MYFGWITKGIAALIGLALAAFLGLWLFFADAGRDETKVVFLSVGQGDAILLSRGSEQILIDGGRDGKRLLSHLGRHIPFFDRRIEAVIATHPDADHIGGFPALFRQYRIENFFSTGATSTTETWRALERLITGDESPTIFSAIAPTELEIPDGGVLSILFPETPLPPDADETNTGSVVARFVFGETSFLLTGDLPEEELYVPDAPISTVLKVAHHGSKYSTSEAWLDLVQPKEAIISVGENRYGHPAPEVLERLAKRGIVTLRTDEQGDIVYRCRIEWSGCRRDE